MALDAPVDADELGAAHACSPFEGEAEGWALSRHLERLGGILVRPRATLARLLSTDEGRLWSILLWLLVLAVALRPERVGRAVLVIRSDALGGLFLLLNTLVTTVSVPLAVIIGSAALLHFGARASHRRLPLDRALDVAGFLVVPFLFLAAVGIVLAAAGLDIGALPHHRLKGPVWVVAVRAAVAFGGTAMLLAFALKSMPRFAPPRDL